MGNCISTDEKNKTDSIDGEKKIANDSDCNSPVLVSHPIRQMSGIARRGTLFQLDGRGTASTSSTNPP